MLAEAAQLDCLLLLFYSLSLLILFVFQCGLAQCGEYRTGSILPSRCSVQTYSDPPQVLPVISGLCWLGTLLGLLIHWLSGTHRRRYPSMDPSQSVAYISDVGAFELKPLFITGAVVMTVFLDLSFLCERWLRHQRRLVPNLTMTEKLLSGFSIVFAAIGTVGLISLSCLDTYHHPTLHDVFLIVFIVGFVVNAILVCAEYQRLGISKSTPIPHV